MSSDVSGSRARLRLPLALYSLVLALLALVSWLGDGWGYFVLYGFILVAFALVVGVVSIVLARRSPARGTSRATAFLGRSLRSFFYAQITLATALIASALLARLTSGPLGPFAGAPFDDPLSEGRFEESFPSEGGEIQLQIPGDPPYTITTHAFVIDGALYVGADFVFPFKRWVEIVQRDPAVLVRTGGRLFQRSAAHIRDPAESRRLLEEVSRQRGVHPDDWLTDVWFFRMDAAS